MLRHFFHTFQKERKIPGVKFFCRKFCRSYFLSGNVSNFFNSFQNIAHLFFTQCIGPNFESLTFFGEVENQKQIRETLHFLILNNLKNCKQNLSLLSKKEGGEGLLYIVNQVNPGKLSKVFENYILVKYL